MDSKPLYNQQQSLLQKFGKIQPQAVDFEEAVLGQLILNGKSIIRIVDILEPEMFYNDANKKIYTSLINLYDKHEPIDLLTVTNQLKKEGELEMVGGPYAITMLVSKVGSVVNLEYHARIIIQKYIARDVIASCSKLINDAFDDTTDAIDLIESFNDAAFKNSLVTTKKNNESAGELADEMITYIVDVKSGKIKEQGLQSHIISINNVLYGFRAPDLLILAGRPGQGKTALMVSIVLGLAEQSIPVGVFSLEMSSRQLMYRLASQKTGIPYQKLANIRELHDSDFILFKKALEDIKLLPIIINDDSGLTIRAIRSKSKEMKVVKKVGMIFIDYIQLINGSKDSFSREGQVSEISRGAKHMAKDLDIPVMALSQLSRKVEDRTGNRPKLSDLRESGCLIGETKIQCPSLKRTFRIEDLVGRKNFNIFATNYDKVKYMKAKKCFKTEKKEVYEIELLNSQKIQATANHKFLTPNGWIRMDKLDGQRIAIPIDYGDIKSDIHRSEIELIGHFLSNGCMIKGRSITYTCNVIDDDLTERVMLTAKQATLDKIKPYYKDSEVKGRKWRTIFFKPTFHLTHGKTSPMSDIFRKYNLWDVRSKQKFIPDVFFYLSHEKTNILLRALFTGDGAVYYREKDNRKSLTISYSSASDELIYDIQQLLAKVGIISFISKLENKKGQKWNNLYISGRDNIQRYIENIGFLSLRKNDIMNNGWNKVKQTRKGWNKYSFNNERTLCYMPVKKIVPKGVKEVYDIEVPDLHNFVANNIIVHNSIEQDADVVMFMYRPAYYKIKEDPTGKFSEEQMAVLCELEFAKNRNGALTTIPLKFTKSAMRFTDFYDQESDIQTEIDLDDDEEAPY